MLVKAAVCFAERVFCELDEPASLVYKRRVGVQRSVHGDCLGALSEHEPQRFGLLRISLQTVDPRVLRHKTQTQFTTPESSQDIHQLLLLTPISLVTTGNACVPYACL